MNSTVVLIALVVASALVSTLLPRRGGHGLITGAEYLLLGIGLGPLGLEVIDRDMAPLIHAVMGIGTAWLGLLLGLRLRLSSLRELGGAGAVAVLVSGMVPLLLVYQGLPLLWRALGLETPLPPWLPLSLGVIAAASSSGTLRWARAYLGARGPLTDRLVLHARMSGLFIPLGLGVLILRWPPPQVPALLASRPALEVAAVLLLGGLMGACFTLLAGRRPVAESAWVLLPGVVLLGSGVAGRLALPALAVCFLSGAVISASTAEHDLFDELSERSERPLVILLLLLLGIGVSAVPDALWLSGCVVVLRVTGKVLAGFALSGLARAGRGGSALRGHGGGLLGFGGVALAGAVQTDALYGGTLTLVAAAALVLAGDVVGPLGLRWVLRRHGETEPREGRAL